MQSNVKTKHVGIYMAVNNKKAISCHMCHWGNCKKLQSENNNLAVRESPRSKDLELT
jgi:hypothetical protein